jgi:tetratricopeptide (TPR) repeat protein
MDKLIEYINYIKENFSSNTALLIGVVFIFSIVNLFDSLIIKIVPNTYDRFSIYGFILIFFLISWLYERLHFPSKKKNYVGLVICIRSENDKQKIRLKNDFLKRLESLIIENKLDDEIQIIPLKEYQANLVIPILKKIGATINRMLLTGAKPDKNIPEINKWLKIQKRIHGHFFVFGDIKERMEEGKNNYYFDLDALVTHAPTDLLVQKRIHEEFINVWFKRIWFQENDELKGFMVAAELLYLAIKYITGTAAVISGDPFLALKLHQNLINDFDKFKTLPPNLINTKKQTLFMIAVESIIIARWHQENGDIENAKKYLSISLKAEPKNYDAFMLQSVIDFTNDNNPEKAINSVEKAMLIAPDEEGTWRYNKAFLLMYQEKFDEALKIYNIISKTNFNGEDKIINGIIKFNENFIKINPDKIQSLFIIGYLKLKKESNYPEALKYFEEFLAKAKEGKKYDLLTKKAYKYKIELEKKMNLIK